MSKQNFLASHKLSSPKYPELFKSGRRFSTPAFSFFYSLDTANSPHLGLVFAKKKIRSAVKRNLCKRLSREYFRKNQYQHPHLQVLINASHKTAELTREDLHECLQKFWAHLEKSQNTSSSL